MSMASQHIPEESGVLRLENLTEVDLLVNGQGRRLKIHVIGDATKMPLRWKPKWPPKSSRWDVSLENAQIVVAVFASRNSSTERKNNFDQVRNLICNMKGRKKTEVYPHQNEAPSKHVDGLRFYRTVVIWSDTKPPIIFTGFGDNPYDHDSSFWDLALKVKTLFHNPKAPQAVNNKM